MLFIHQCFSPSGLVLPLQRILTLHYYFLFMCNIFYSYYKFFRYIPYIIYTFFWRIFLVRDIVVGNSSSTPSTLGYLEGPFISFPQTHAFILVALLLPFLLFLYITFNFYFLLIFYLSLVLYNLISCALFLYYLYFLNFIFSEGLYCYLPLFLYLPFPYASSGLSLYPYLVILI